MRSQPLLLRFYVAMMALYPATFRQRYGQEMADIAAREYAASRARIVFAIRLAGDAVASLLRENLRARSLRPLMLGGFAVFFSTLLAMLALLEQQRLRRSADRGAEAITAQIAEHPESPAAIVRLAAAPEEISSPEWLASAHRFVGVYDASGHPLAANATLEGALPQPPQAIFQAIRSRRLYKVTWQPEHGIRLALTGRPLRDGGFVLAAQSLGLAEERTASFYRHLLLLWGTMAAAVVALFLSSKMRPAHRGL